MGINEALDRLTPLVVNIFKEKKVIGTRDLEMSAKKVDIEITLDDDTVAELCFRLREEGVIAYPQGRGIFRHIRIVE